MVGFQVLRSRTVHGSYRHKGLLLNRVGFYGCRKQGLVAVSRSSAGEEDKIE